MRARSDDSEAEFTEFVRMRGASLRRHAYSLTGDWHLAEDLLQVAFVRVFAKWPSIDAGGREAYTRQVVLRAFLDASRRRWTGERVQERIPDRVDVEDAPSQVDSRSVVRDALLRLPPRVRAVIVCRFVEDLDVATTARVLGVSTGTVKSQTARGLLALRELLALESSLQEQS